MLTLEASKSPHRLWGFGSGFSTLDSRISPGAVGQFVLRRERRKFAISNHKTTVAAGITATTINTLANLESGSMKSMTGLPLRLARSFRPQRADQATRLPHFAVGHRFQLLLQLLAVIRTTISFQHAAGFIAGGYFAIKFFKHRLGNVAEAFEPVQGAALGRRRAVGVHPVHAILSDERIQALRRLFDGFVKSLGRRMAVLAQH